MSADLFDYNGNGLLGGFISEIYFDNVKPLVASFYENPEILGKGEDSWERYYIRIREWLDKFSDVCKIRKPFVSVSPEGVFLAYPQGVAIFRDALLMSLMRGRYDFPTKKEDISFTDEESLKAYMEVLNSK